jgi:hypothetical protein
VTEEKFRLCLVKTSPAMETLTLQPPVPVGVAANMDVFIPEGTKTPHMAFCQCTAGGSALQYDIAWVTGRHLMQKAFLETLRALES